MDLVCRRRSAVGLARTGSFALPGLTNTIAAFRRRAAVERTEVAVLPIRADGVAATPALGRFAAGDSWAVARAVLAVLAERADTVVVTGI